MRSSVVGWLSWTRKTFGSSKGRSCSSWRRPATCARSTSPSTATVSVVDDEGDACAITVSSGYGSGVMTPGTGIWLNNALGEQELLHGGPHSLAPGTRLTSNMAPSVARRDSDGAVLAISSPGSDRIPTAIAQVYALYTHGGLSLREAVEHPRLHVRVREDVVVDYEDDLDAGGLRDATCRPADAAALDVLRWCRSRVLGPGRRPARGRRPPPYRGRGRLACALTCSFATLSQTSRGGPPDMPDPELSVVVPMYDEEEVLPIFFERMHPLLDGLGIGYELLVVDDGSRDATAPDAARGGRRLATAPGRPAAPQLRSPGRAVGRLPPRPRASTSSRSTPTCRTRPR